MIMKTDFQSLCVAEVEVQKVKFSKGPDTGIDFSNEIDAWAKMEFKFRQQIKNLRDQRILDRRFVPKTVLRSERRDLHPTVYAIRQKLD